VDQVTPIRRGGADSPSKMQWQTTEAARVKEMMEDCKDITTLPDYWMALFIMLFLVGIAIWLAYGAGKQVAMDKWKKHLMDRHYADREKAKMEGDGT